MRALRPEEQELAGKVKKPAIEDLNAHYPVGRLPNADARDQLFARMEPSLKTEDHNKAKAAYVAQLKVRYGRPAQASEPSSCPLQTGTLICILSARVSRSGKGSGPVEPTAPLSPSASWVLCQTEESVVGIFPKAAGSGFKLLRPA